MLKFVIALLVPCLAPSVGLCQGLDGDFNQLSAKERSRIAKEEESGAPKDERYQAVMAEAESLFQQQRFDEALLRFQEARDLRPYNVYPRVKIQDLQALIAKRDRANSEADMGEHTEPSAPEPSISREAEHPSGIEAVDTTNGRMPADHDPQQRSNEASGPLPGKPRTGTTAERTERVAEKSPEPLEEGQLIYKEGRAVVVERRVAQEGRIAVFRKVTHPWGAVVYFKDAAAIPERMWTEIFGSR